MHFEELWEKSEKFYKSNDDTIDNILNELILKIDLLKVIESKGELLKEEKEKAVSRLFGEILLSLTNLSLKENVDVFEALRNSLIISSRS